MTTPRTAATTDARKRRDERLQYPGAWLPGDKVDLNASLSDTACSFMFLGDGLWRCQSADHGHEGTEVIECRLTNGLARITHRVPRPDLPPTLPDTSGWVKREPGDVIPMGARYLYVEDAEVAVDRGFKVGPNDAVWTPPPAPAPAWSVISTDRDQPTLARVTLNLEDGYDAAIGSFWVDADGYLVLGRVSTFAHRSCVEGVELLHTHDPETHVPVERSLVDEAARRIAWLDDDEGRSCDSRLALTILRDLAALADGAQS